MYIFIHGEHDEAVWGFIFLSSKHGLGFMSGRYEKSIARVARRKYISFINNMSHFHFLGQNIFLFQFPGQDIFFFKIPGQEFFFKNLVCPPLII